MLSLGDNGTQKHSSATLEHPAALTDRTPLCPAPHTHTSLGDQSSTALTMSLAIHSITITYCNSTNILNENTI